MSRLTKAVRKFFGIQRRRGRASTQPENRADARKLISVHLPKCAGTSFLKILGTQYATALLLDYDDVPLDPESLFQKDFAAWKEKQTVALARDYKSIAAVHGHFWAGKYDQVLPGAFKITWLRDPVLRVVSHYYYWKREPALPNSLHRLCVEQNVSLSDFIEFPIMQNVYTATFLKDHSLSDFEFVGICEFFTQDLEHLQHQLGWHNVVQPQENRTDNPEYNALKLEPALEARIRKLNEADLDLYHAALTQREKNLRARKVFLLLNAQAPSASGPEVKAARTLLHTGDVQDAFRVLNSLKARHLPVRDVDLLRATCFLVMEQPFAAVEALKEELRYFPDNECAARLLAEVSLKTSTPITLGPPEFREIYEQVRPFTMLGPARLLSLFVLARQVCDEDLPGNFVECGVAAGGSSALLAAVVARYSRRPRRVFSVDSFQGMPAPSPADQHQGVLAETTGWGTGTCSAPIDSLRNVCRALAVEHLVEPVKGLFGEVLPRCRERIGPIAFLHMDGDWYSSTWDILVNLYDQVMPGGRIQIDDFGHWDGCRKAVADFQAARGSHWQLHPIDETGVWMSKTG